MLFVSGFNLFLVEEVDVARGVEVGAMMCIKKGCC